MQRSALSALSAFSIFSSACLLTCAPAWALDATTPPKADPAMQKVLDTLSSLGGKPIETLSAAEARQQPSAADAVKQVLRNEGKDDTPERGLTVKQFAIDGPQSKIPLFVYTPAGKGPFPVMLYYHGGGFVIADTKTYDASIRALATGANAIIVSADYRQAPEHKFPAAPDDAYAAYQWVLKHASDINGDPARVAVGGESAGGNLATVVSMMARDRHEKMPVHQLLIYPVLDGDTNTPSYQNNAQAQPLNKAMMKWFFTQYTANSDDAFNPYVVPMKAESLKGLPSATVVAAELDPLMNEGKTYADRLKEDGVAVSYKAYPGVTHEFFGMGAVEPKAKDAEKFAAAGLRKAFDSVQ